MNCTSIICSGITPPNGRQGLGWKVDWVKQAIPGLADMARCAGWHSEEVKRDLGSGMYRLAAGWQVCLGPRKPGTSGSALKRFLADVINYGC